jgi:membrane-bound serine protease (ClpP class)
VSVLGPIITAVETVVVLLVIGAILLLLETVLPGMVAGVIGLLCLGAAVVLTYSKSGAQAGNLLLICVLGALTAGAMAWLKFFPNSRMGQIFVSTKTVGEIGTEQPELLHQTGSALTPLRPCGTALINGKRVDVVTEGSHVASGSQLKVIAIEGFKVVVRAV